jgi:hypothetical protein
MREETRRLERSKRELNHFQQGYEADGEDEEPLAPNAHDVPHLGDKQLRRVPATVAQKHRHRVQTEADASRQQDREQHNKYQVRQRLDLWPTADSGCAHGKAQIRVYFMDAVGAKELRDSTAYKSMDADSAAKYDRQEQGAPVVPKEPLFDLSSASSSRWNQANIELMVEPLRVQLRVSEEMYNHQFGVRSDDFLKLQLSTVLENFRRPWLLVQPKLRENGTMETREEALARAGRQLIEQDEAARAGGRRRDVSPPQSGRIAQLMHAIAV